MDTVLRRNQCRFSGKTTLTEQLDEAAGRLQVYEKPVQVLKLKRFRAFLRTEADGFALKAGPRGDSR